MVTGFQRPRVHVVHKTPLTRAVCSTADSWLLAIVWCLSACECVNSKEQASNCVLTITSPSRASISHDIKATKVKMDSTGLTMWYSAGKLLLDIRVDTKGHKPPDLTATALQLKYIASSIDTRGLHCSLSRTVLAGTWQNLFSYSPRDVTWCRALKCPSPNSQRTQWDVPKWIQSMERCWDDRMSGWGFIGQKTSTWIP